MEKTMYEFTNENNTCVIRDPRPPRYWYNYLWNENGYCAQVSQTGHGRSYYINEKADMCMLNNHDARYLYLRDEKDRACWNVGEAPLNTPVDGYQCAHSIGCSILQSTRNGIQASWRLFVPRGGYHELWTITLHNQGEQAREMSVFPAVTFDLEGFRYPRYYEMYRCMETSFDQELNGIYCSSAHPFAPHKRYNAFLASSEPVFAYDGDLAAFCGATGSITKPDASAYALFQRPRVVTEGLNCTNSEGALFILGGALQHRITLAADETKTIHFALGVSESLDEARSVAQEIKTTGKVESAFARVQTDTHKQYPKSALRTPDEKVNAMMNAWGKKQVDFCIVGKKGVRDNLQIAVAMLGYRQEKAKAEILECLSHQFRDGHAVLTWYPYDDTRYSDQPFWIIWAVCELIKETGDFSILDQCVPWQDGGCATVLEHVKAAVDRLIRDKGRNGLVRIYFADWNDALNITTDENAESVMLSHQFCLALRELEALMKHIGKSEYAAYLGKEYKELKAKINEVAWDGDWYVRALTKDGAIGSKDSMGSRIYLNAQTWAVLAGVADAERLPKLLCSIDAMEHDFGFPLNEPPYTRYSPMVGRMSGMLPGLFENGGVYCHATGFKILMDCALGRSCEALRTLKKTMPDSELNPSSQSGAEPYVFTNFYSTHPKYFGRSYQSWTTGTSAWCMMGLYEGIMGIHRALGGLRIKPCFPSEWGLAEVNRHFRDANYHILICNPDHLDNGKAVITVDGRQLQGDVLPDFRDGRTHDVAVILK